MQVFKDWFLGFEEEVFIVDNHPGVRPHEAPSNEAQWSHRGLQYFKFAEARRDLGLPADIHETEPDFLMAPLPNQALEAAAVDGSMPVLPQEIHLSVGTADAKTSGSVIEQENALPLENGALHARRHAKM